MQEEMGLREEIYGIGEGMLFIGYLLFEIKRNIMINKIGESMWIERIMIKWGMMQEMFELVKKEWKFYIMRLMIGEEEEGFYKGVIIYMKYWLK